MCCFNNALFRSLSTSQERAAMPCTHLMDMLYAVTFSRWSDPWTHLSAPGLLVVFNETMKCRLFSTPAESNAKTRSAPRGRFVKGGNGMEASRHGEVRTDGGRMSTTTTSCTRLPLFWWRTLDWFIVTRSSTC